MMHCIARNAITCVALIIALLAATGPAPAADLTGQAIVIDGDPIKTHTRFSRWAKSGVWKTIFEMLAADAGQRIRDDRQHHRTRARAQRRRSNKDGEDQAIGRSKGGLSTKIHAMVDALGNPLAGLGGFWHPGYSAGDVIGG